MIDNRKVLVVDDKQPVLDTICSWMTELGFVVETASNGLDGLEKSLNGEFQLIIIDHLMPLMNGIQLAKNLKQKPRTKDTPLLFMTTQELKPIVDSPDAQFFIDIISKPLDKNTFFTSLRDHLTLNTQQQSL